MLPRAGACMCCHSPAMLGCTGYCGGCDGTSECTHSAIENLNRAIKKQEKEKALKKRESKVEML